MSYKIKAMFNRNTCLKKGKGYGFYYDRRGDKIKSILVIIFTIVCLQLVALGAFNLFNQRNHSELKWHEISTKTAE